MVSPMEGQTIVETIPVYNNKISLFCANNPNLNSFKNFKKNIKNNCYSESSKKFGKFCYLSSGKDKTNTDVKTCDHPNYLSCLYNSPTSLNNKLSELEAVLTEKKFPHIVFKAETWFSELSVTTITRYTEKTEEEELEVSVFILEMT